MSYCQSLHEQHQPLHPVQHSAQLFAWKAYFKETTTHQQCEIKHCWKWYSLTTTCQVFLWEWIINHCIYTQSAIEIINVTNVVINDITLEMWTRNVSGVIVEWSTDVHLQLHIHSVQGNDSLAAGVAVNETSHLYMDGLQVGNFIMGLE